jgi:L-ascorbate metabolism protein UlaG (beta-lactamase superfamily)
MSAEAVQIRWLGQAGFEIRAPDGRTLMIDPYLSDDVERELGSKRIVPAPIAVDEAEPDVLVATHWHPDHLDPGLCRSLARRGARTICVGPSTNASRLRGWGIADERIRDLDRGQAFSHAGFAITAGFARHEVPGWLCEDAISVAVEVAGVRIFHCGDTEYDARVLDMREHGPFDVGLFVINGTGGCMNASEAALMAHALAPSVAVPCHYGMWAPEHYGRQATLDPTLFAQTCRRLGGPQTHILEHGASLRIRAHAPVPSLRA